MQIHFDVPDSTLHDLLDGVPIPHVARVRYDMVTPAACRHLGSTVRDQMRRAGIRDMVYPGQQIAIAVGSRGINRLSEIVTAVVAQIRECGAHPFIVPAMGSHGGATAGGQREVLESLGVTAERVGAPIESQMATEEIGRAADGTPVHLDRLAMAADGIVVVARIKPHTAFRGTYESGLAKMIAIGLGKQAGAAATHARGFGEMARMVPAMAEVALRVAPIVMAVGVLENARDEVFKVVAVPSDRIMAEEPALLQEAKAAMPRIPFPEFDVLVIDEIGKDISGDGADPNITGRYPTPDASGPPEVDKLVVLDLTSATGGNANGIGLADFITVRAATKIRLNHIYPNALTSTVPGTVKIPMILPSDRLTLAAALLTCHAVGREPRLMRIKNTLRLDEFWVSTALLDDVRQDPQLCVLEGPGPVQFDAAGNLTDLRHETASAGSAPVRQYDVW